MKDRLTGRKQSHLSICMDEDVAFKNKTTFFDEVELVHLALPETGFDSVNTETVLLGKQLRMPFLIGAMTGGTGDGRTFNQDLAGVAQTCGVGMCLGSIRPVLEHPELKPEFEVRKDAPDILLLSNIGAGQIEKYTPAAIVDMSKELGADGIFVHLNAGMELVQPGGDRNFSGHVDAIGRLVEEAGEDLPVAVKETGMGLSYIDGTRLKKAGVRTVETGSAGGTSWAAVESFRSEGNQRRLGEMLWDFGIPTAVSCAWMVEHGFTVIASGGILGPMDMVKALAMGANGVAMARPVLHAYESDGARGVEELLGFIEQGVRYLMVCCGADTVAKLQRTPLVKGAALQDYIAEGKRSRGI